MIEHDDAYRTTNEQILAVLLRIEARLVGPGERMTATEVASHHSVTLTHVDLYLAERAHEVTPQHLRNMGLILRGFMPRPDDPNPFHPTAGALRLYKGGMLHAGRSPTTVNQHLVIIGAFLDWCAKRGLCAEGLCKGLRVKRPKNASSAAERAAFTDAEMRRVLCLDAMEVGATPATATVGFWGATRSLPPAHRWLPLIMAYSGARPEEVAQLRVCDVKLADDLSVPSGGVWVFDFATLEGDVRRKSEAARRMVPVHPKLIELGLLEHVNMRHQSSSNPALFPELKPGHNGRRAEAPSRWFNKTWLRDRCGIKDKRKVLYSLRHTVATKLKHQGVEESLIAELLGHSNPSITTGRYGKRYEVAKLAEVLGKLSY